MHAAPMGNPLIEDPAAYFELGANPVHLPLDCLHPTRKRREGIANAVRYMAAAARGERPKRAPLDVEPAGHRRWRILDGNSTYFVARASGWKTIPCIVRQVSGDAGKA